MITAREKESGVSLAQRLDDTVAISRVQEQVGHRQLVQEGGDLGKGGAARIRVVAEALHESVTAVAKQQQAEQFRASRGETMGIVHEDPRNPVAWKVVLQEIQLEDHRRDVEHAALPIQNLPVLHTAGLQLTSQTPQATFEVISRGNRAASRVIVFSSASMSAFYAVIRAIIKRTALSPFTMNTMLAAVLHFIA